mmetsp:Transcript_38920/g.60663  ORF Transcript_38920/g.60663 Transcript_38920/m.60663 type:complete len:184 (-) Transcript_38920:207-758(-)
MVRLSYLAMASAVVLGAEAFTPSVSQLPCSQGVRTSAPSALCMQGENLGRRSALKTFGTSALSLGFVSLVAGQAAGAEEAGGDRPLIPDSELIKPRADGCAQGVGGKCTELAEGNPLILKLQEKSSKNRLKYQKQELESYWNRNYKDFFDASCNNWNKDCQFEQIAPGKWRVRKQDPMIKLRE